MDTEIVSNKAANVAGVNSPGRRMVYSMCGMCAVRCPIEVSVEDGRAVWIQGNTNDPAMGASLCAKGSAGLALDMMMINVQRRRLSEKDQEAAVNGNVHPGTKRWTLLQKNLKKRLMFMAVRALSCQIVEASLTT